MTNDYKGKKFTASLTAVNTDVIENSGEYFVFFKEKRFYLIF